MKVAIFDTHDFERQFFQQANFTKNYELTYFETRLKPETASLAQGFHVACCFVNDQLGAPTLSQLKKCGVQLIALRSAGFNHVDLKEASRLGLPVVRVPAYSPHGVAEHAVGLLLALNRKIHKAYLRTREFNFSLEGLVGFDLYGKTIGVVGTGKIGAVFGKIMKGFGCKVLAYDLVPNPELCGDSKIVEYVDLNEVYRHSDVISLHLPLTQKTHHMVGEKALKTIKPGAILLNTSRGALVDASQLIEALKSGRLAGAALDVYEEEEEVFFHDVSTKVLQDDVLARLMTFPNVIMTSHQGFLTKEALTKIAETTLENIKDFESKKPLRYQVSL